MCYDVPALLNYTCQDGLVGDSVLGVDQHLQQREVSPVFRFIRVNILLHFAEITTNNHPTSHKTANLPTHSADTAGHILLYIRTRTTLKKIKKELEICKNVS